MPDIYESKSPFTFKQPCKSCGEDFEQTLSQVGYPREVCRECRGGTSSALVRQGERSLVKEGAVVAPEKREQVLSRVQELLVIASAPCVPRGKTFTEWLFKEDPNEAARQARAFAGQQARELLALREQFLELMREESKAKRFVLQQELEVRLDVKRAELEWHRLSKAVEEERSETEAIEAQRYIRRLEEAHKVKALLEGSPTSGQSKQGNPEVEKMRRRFSEKSEAQQALIDDFRQKLASIVLSDFDDEEKAQRIRLVLEIYKFGREVLPEQIRRFLETVEERVGI